LTVLSDGEILRRLRRGGLGIDPFTEEHLTPNGYDLTIGELQPAGGKPVSRGSLEVKPGGWFAVATAERVRLPRDLSAELWLRSSHIRKGIVTTFGRVDAGFAGSLTVTGFNAGQDTLSFAVGDRYCQIVFVVLGAPAEKPYAARSGAFQGQTGITLERFSGKGGRGRATGKGKGGKGR
jgi:dCTP deaminase